MMSRSAKNGRNAETFVISRYLDNPLLIDGKKFDLRTYILVTNYSPLKVWRYKEGFARLCLEDYQHIKKNSAKDPNKELFGHLTNVSFQKYSANYNSSHGGKWPLSKLFLYIELNYGKVKVNELKMQMD